jgi:hypothetical protein
VINNSFDAWEERWGPASVGYVAFANIGGSAVGDVANHADNEK